MIARSAIESMGDTKNILVLEQAMKSNIDNIRLETVELLKMHDSPEADSLLIHHAMHDKSMEVRQTAVSAMGDRDDERYLDALLQILDKKDTATIELAASGICDIRSPRATAKLKEIYKNLNSYPEPQHFLAIDILNSLKNQCDPEYYDLCYWGLQHKKTALYTSLALGRGVHGPDSETIEFLARVLIEGNQLARQESAQLLTRKQDMRALPVLFDMVENTDAEVRSNAVGSFSALCDYGREDNNLKNIGEESFYKVESVLLKAVTDEEDGVRCEAVSALHNIGSSHAIRIAIEALEDPSDRVKYSASRVLSKSDAPNAIDAMINILKTSDDSSRISYAIEGLLKSGDERVHELILPLLDSDDGEVRIDSALALLKLADNRVWDLLVDAMNDSELDGNQRAIIADNLCESGDPRAVEVLLEALERINCGDDEDDNLLLALIDNLGKLGDQRATEPIRKWIGYEFPGHLFFHLSKHDDDSATEALRALGALPDVISENN